MAKKSYPPLVLELTDRRPSAFVMKGTENSENPDRLDTASEYLLMNTSVVMQGDKRRPIRYIAGCDLIYVDEQEKSGFKPNPKQDTIPFIFGRLTVQREGRTIGLYDFLSNHDGNRSLPRDKRPSGAVDVFYQVNTSLEAENKLADLDEMTQVMTLLNGLRERVNKPGGGASSYKYDTDKIEYYCKLLGVVSASMESDAEKLQLLLTVATKNPTYFVSLVNEVSGDMRVEVVTAKQLAVISTDGPAASWVDDQRVFFPFKSKDANKRIDELVEYFKSSEGEMDLSVMRTKVKFKQDSDTETK